MTGRSAEFLFINNNNTRTKFALCSRDALLEHRAVETSAVSIATVTEAIKGWGFEKIVIASVVPRDVPTLLDSIRGKPHIIVNHEIKLGIEIDFPKPGSVGADRLANAAAIADQIGDQPVIVVDFGTAVTFDIVDTRPAYVGGVIAPGLESMTRYLHQRTALLPRIEIREPEGAIGKSTEHAMLSGAFHGYRGLVIEIINQIEKELGSSAKIVATGGYADLISRDLAVIDEVQPYLTMEGLRKIAILNFPL
ncbi:MAG: type III pantothenate kinase [Verrucomicrobiales bacterium]|nr:type III pantothenate kinase [Verrucomicrobiales bacterium]